MKRLAVMVIVALRLCGCSSDSDWKHQAYAFAVPPDPPPTGGAANRVALGRVSLSPRYQCRSFTYRLADASYEQDPYAGFLVSPERTLAEAIRGWMRAGGALVLDPGSGLTPSMVVEVAVNELYGDLRNSSQPTGTMEIHFCIYQTGMDGPGRIVLDKTCAQTTPMSRKMPAALMAAWDEDLRQIMKQINSEYAKTHINDSGR